MIGWFWHPNCLFDMGIKGFCPKQRDTSGMRKGLRVGSARLMKAVSLLFLVGLYACGANDVPVEVRSLVEENTDGGTELASAPLHYLIGPGDLLRITYLGENNLDSNILVLPDGSIIAPMLEESVLASGLTVDQLRADIEKRLGRYLVEPQVFIHPVKISNQHVFVLGEVKNPHLATSEPLTLAGVISACGGLTNDGQKKQILVIRKTSGGEHVVFDVNFMKLLKGESALPNLPLQRYDIVVVPKSRVARARDFMMAAFGNNIVATRFAIDGILLQDALEEELNLYYNSK